MTPMCSFYGFLRIWYHLFLGLQRGDNSLPFNGQKYVASKKNEHIFFSFSTILIFFVKMQKGAYNIESTMFITNSRNMVHIDYAIIKTHNRSDSSS